MSKQDLTKIYSDMENSLEELLNQIFDELVQSHHIVLRRLDNPEASRHEIIKNVKDHYLQLIDEKVRHEELAMNLRNIRHRFSAIDKLKRKIELLTNGLITRNQHNLMKKFLFLEYKNYHVPSTPRLKPFPPILPNNESSVVPNKYPSHKEQSEFSYTPSPIPSDAPSSLLPTNFKPTIKMSPAIQIRIQELILQHESLDTIIRIVSPLMQQLNPDISVDLINLRIKQTVEKFQKNLVFSTTGAGRKSSTPSNWVLFVKKFAQDHGLSYACALSNPQVSVQYKAWKNSHQQMAKPSPKLTRKQSSKSHAVKFYKSTPQLNLSNPDEENYTYINRPKPKSKSIIAPKKISEPPKKEFIYRKFKSPVLNKFTPEEQKEYDDYMKQKKKYEYSQTKEYADWIKFLRGYEIH
jgi:hypothetical protein